VKDWDFPNPHVVTLEVLADDIDAYNHVNNAVYLSWLDEAAWSHSAALGLSLEKCLEMRRGMAAHHTEIDYVRAAVLGDANLVVAGFALHFGCRRACGCRRRLGRCRKISQAIRPTKIGVLFPNKVAFAAEVFSMEVLKKAKSSAKKMPPPQIIASVRASTRGALRSITQVGASTSAGISKR